jgi:hypothetical protein
MCLMTEGIVAVPFGEKREKREKRGYGRVEAVLNNTMTVVSAANGGYAYK